MKINKILKIIGGVLLTILIGAIGSGVWEKLLSPFLLYLSGSVTEFLSSISQSYENGIYSNASTIKYEGQAGNFFLLSFLALAFYLLYTALSTKVDNKVIKSIYSVIRMYRQGWTGIFFSGGLLITQIQLISA